jgi:hypothetical protein
MITCLRILELKIYNRGHSNTSSNQGNMQYAFETTIHPLEKSLYNTCDIHVLGRVLWVKTHPTRPKIPSGLGRVLPIKPDPARDRVGLGN